MRRTWHMQCALQVFRYALPVLLLLLAPAAVASYFSDTKSGAALFCAAAAVVALTVGFFAWATRGWAEYGGRLEAKSGLFTISEFSIDRARVMGISQVVSPLHRLVGAVRFEVLGVSGARCSLLIGAAQALELSQLLIGRPTKALAVIRRGCCELSITEDMIVRKADGAVRSCVCIPIRAISSVYSQQVFKRRRCALQTPAGSALMLAGADRSESEELFFSILSIPQEATLLAPKEKDTWHIYYRRVGLLLLFLAVFLRNLHIILSYGAIAALGAAAICAAALFSAAIGCAYAARVGIEIASDQVVIRTVRLFCFEERRLLRSKLACVHISASMLERALGVCSASFYPSGEQRAVVVCGLPYERTRALIIDRGL